MSRALSARVAAAAAHWLSGRAERAAIERDVREEFQAHLLRIEEDLRSQGLDEQAARTQSRERFGDIEKLVRDATKIKAGGSRMLQRINLALLVVMILIVGWMALQMRQSQQRNIALIEAVSARLEDSGHERRTAPPPDGPMVYISGAVGRPGPYAIPSGGMSLRRALVAADMNGPHDVVITHRSGGESSSKAISKQDLADPAGVDVDLAANDLVVVEPASTTGLVSPTGNAAVTAERGSAARVAFVQGAVKAPGSYLIPQPDFTLRRLLTAAGLSETTHDVAIRRTGPGGKPVITTVRSSDLSDPAGPDPIVQPDDIVTVY